MNSRFLSLFSSHAYAIDYDNDRWRGKYMLIKKKRLSKIKLSPANLLLIVTICVSSAAEAWKK